MSSTLNGIDYLEVYLSQSPVDQTFQALILVFCLKPLSTITQQNIIIEGGVRIRDLSVKWVYRYDQLENNIVSHSNIPPDLSIDDFSALDSINQRFQNLSPADQNNKFQSIIVVRTIDGDFSQYTLGLVSSQNASLPYDNFDERLYKIDFTYKIDCEADFDCRQESNCIPQVFDEPTIDCMAKDYTSFRQLLLDRLRLINPNWTETNPSDHGIMYVELLAHVADQISYSQDTAATQGYLGTATQRVAVRRHARLVDYTINDGSNARAWISIIVEPGSPAEGQTIHGAWKRGVPRTIFYTGNPSENAIVSSADFQDNISSEAIVFEAMHDITLQSSLNQLEFYTWSGSNCYLPTGSTSATLINQNGSLYGNNLFCWSQFTNDDKQSLVNFLKNNFGWNWIRTDLVLKKDSCTIQILAPTGPILITLNTANTVATLTYQDQVYEFQVKQDNSGNLEAYCLSLQAGNVLLFEEIRSIESPKVEGNRTHRKAVRLVSAIARTDALTHTKVVDIQWHQDDALDFPLCLYVNDDFANPVSVVRGNVLLVDHGQTIENEVLSDSMMNVSNTIESAHKFYPKLSNKPLTHGTTYCNIQQQDGTFASAKSVYQQDPTQVFPWIEISDSNSNLWEPSYDLLDKTGEAQYFVAEMEDDGSTHIRFGDGTFGAIPEGPYPDKYFARYRVGNGSTGNVAAESINKIVLDGISGISSVRNPLAASGGTDPETLDEIRQYAPQAFRTQMRAVTMDDYVQVLKHRQEVQNASASLIWTGSWYTVFVTVNRKGGLEVDDNYKKEIANYLWQYRLTGYDIEVMQPIYAALEIVLEICVAPNYHQDDVEEQLLAIFSNHILQDGSLGFFYPDNLSFGQPLYLSQMYGRAMKIDGVSSIEVIKFHRLGSLNDIELVNGVFTPAPFEIISVNNDPNNSEKGKISFEMSGGI